MTDLSELLERVKAATGPDRELDVEIFCALNPDYRPGKNQLGGTVIVRDGFRWPSEEIVPFLSASIDAALALTERVLPGWSMKLYRHPPSVYVTLYKLGGVTLAPSGRPDRVIEHGPFEYERHGDAQAPLAILAALLLALQSQATK